MIAPRFEVVSHLSNTGKPQPRVLAAIARELAGFIWDIARKTPLPA